MNRLNQLIKHHNSGSINESDYHELVELLLKVTSEQRDMVKYFDDQLEFLIKETVKSNKTRKVN